MSCLEALKTCEETRQSLNECCRIITGCLKPTRTDHLHILAGISPPGIRRTVASQSELVRQQNDPHHPMFQHTLEMLCQRSRSSFISSTGPLDDSASHTCTCLWHNSLNVPNNTTPDMKITAMERLPAGAHLERSQVGCCKTNMVMETHQWA